MIKKMRVVIQARMESSRLPGKILAPIAGYPLLGHVVRRLRAAGDAEAGWEVHVATTTRPADDVTEQLCRKLGVFCFRGPSEDVLGRFVEASRDLSEDDLVIRATADNPLYCPRRSAAIVGEHNLRDADYTCVEGLSYVVPEVIRAGALRQMAVRATDSKCREHVTPYFRRSGHGFDVATLPRHWFALRPEIRLTIDTPEELQQIASVIESIGLDWPLLPLERVYDLYEQKQPSKRRAA